VLRQALLVLLLAVEVVQQVLVCRLVHIPDWQPVRQ
jgi:hypothetical protein